MTLAQQIANDWQVVDGVEEVTFQARDADQAAVGAAVSGVKALQRAVGGRAIRDFGTVGLSATDTVFHLWVSTLGGVKPSAGDTLEQADGTVWNILAASLETLGTRYRCPAKKQV